jgi:hypothetical protein
MPQDQKIPFLAEAGTQQEADPTAELKRKTGEFQASKSPMSQQKSKPRQNSRFVLLISTSNNTKGVRPDRISTIWQRSYFTYDLHLGEWGLLHLCRQGSVD